MAALVADAGAEADDEARRRHGGWPVFVGRRRPAQIFDKPELAPEEKRAGVADTTARDARLAKTTKGMTDEQYLCRGLLAYFQYEWLVHVSPAEENDAESGQRNPEKVVSLVCVLAWQAFSLCR